MGGRKSSRLKEPKKINRRDDAAIAPKKTPEQIKTTPGGRVTRRQQLLAKASSDGADRSESKQSLRLGKRSLAESDATNDEQQRRSSKRARLQIATGQTLTTPLPKEGRTLRKRSKITAKSNSAISQKKLLIKPKRKTKVTSVIPKRRPQNRKTVKPKKDIVTKDKTNKTIIRKDVKQTKRVLQPFKNQRKVVSKIELVVADGNNNAVVIKTDTKKRKEKRKSDGQGKADKGTAEKPVKKARKGKNRLDPKPFVTEYLQDPTFHSREYIPHISTFANSRLLIRAVLLEDKKLLEELINDKKSICTLKMGRSLNNQRDAYSYALEKGNLDLLDLLMVEDKKDFAHFPSIILQEESTGHNSTYMFGHAVRSVTVGRGGREGNNALLKDKGNYLHYYHSSAKTQQFMSNKDISQALVLGTPLSKLKEMTDKLTGNPWEEILNICFHKVQKAVRYGHNQIAGELMKFGLEKEGYGFNKLHQEVLLNTIEPLTPFKSVSVIKKAMYKARITPLHCACINPNPEYLKQLLNSNPLYDIADKDKWLPVHYASVCSGKGPLEVLLSRDVSITQYNKAGRLPIHLAAYNGRVENVECLLDYDSKKATPETASQSLIERKTKDGYTPLHIAVYAGHLQVVKFLIQRGANASKFTPAATGKLSPLMIAALHGHLEILKFLIENDVKIDAVDNRGRTALTLAVIDGHAHIVSYLLRLGANHKITDSSLNTLVHYAAAYGWYFNLKLLLEAGCPLNEENAWKMTPLVIAFSKGHMGIVEFILGKCDVNINSIINDKNGMTLLLQTCAGDPTVEYCSKVKFLIEEQKADVTIPDFDKNNALHYVVLNEAKQLSEKHEGSEVQKSIFEVAKLLIDRGCDPLAKNSENQSPIFIAFSRKCLLLTIKFLEWGYPLPEEVDKDGNNFLHIISMFLENSHAIELYKSCSENQEYLEKMKKMANEHNTGGYPPLLYLLNTKGQVTDTEHLTKIWDYFLFLVNTLDADIAAMGSKPHSRNSIFHILVEVAYNNIDKALEIILPLHSDLEQKNFDHLTPLAFAISKKREAAAIALINAGANVNTKLLNETSLLMHLGEDMYSSLTLFQLLLAKGANPLVISRNTGNTILHHMVKRQNLPIVIETIELLIKSGIDVNAKNKDGRTALHLVVNSRGGETDTSYEIEKILIKAGADLSIRDNRGRLPLHMAFVKIFKHEDTSFIDPIELVALLVGAMKDTVKDFSNEIKKGDEFGSTPLHYAAFRGASICCSYLVMLMNGFKDPLDKKGNTPFGLAILNGHEGCTLQFQQLGADFTLMLNTGENSKIDVPKEINIWQWHHRKHLNEEGVRQRKQIISKHPIIEEVIRKDWQGILYLMLENLNTSGKGSSLAIASAIRQTRLKLTDKLTDQAIATELRTKDGNSLLHTLAKEYTGHDTILITKIVKTLISKGVSPATVDLDGCTPLIHAAIHRNHVLCKLLVDMTPEREHASFKTFDKYGRNAFTALLWTMGSGTVFTEKEKMQAEHLLKQGVSANKPCVFTIQLQDFPSIRYLQCKSQLEILPLNFTPLIYSIIVGNYDVVKWLLTMKVPNDVDVNGVDNEGRTGLMHAVRLNDIKMVKLLLNPESYDFRQEKNPWLKTNLASISNSKLSFSIEDKRGYTAADYLVAAYENFYFANAKFILSLIGPHLQVQKKSGDGISPLERAIKRNQINLVESMEELLGVDISNRTKFIQPFKELYEPKYENTKMIKNFIADYQEMKKIMIEADKANAKDIDAVPDADPVLKNSDQSKEYTVMIDDKECTPYNCSLIHVDISYGTYGLNNFYKMQVVEQERGPIKVILLFTRWGRVGDTGQYQKTPFPTKEEAIKEFKKVFRAKTGNSWENLNSFVPVDKKYKLVNEESEAKRPSPVKIDFTLLKNTECHPKSDIALSKHIVKLMKTFCLNHSGVNYNSGLPRGGLTVETYKRGEDILEKISSLIQDNKKDTGNAQEQENRTKAIEMLSEEYYSLIPEERFSSGKIRPITSESDIRSKQEWIHRLIHLNLASQMILAAQYNLSHKKVNPFDYIYKCLNSNLHILDPNGEEAQLILEYIDSSEESWEVNNIYSVERHGELDRFRNNGCDNPWLLWHGTTNVNLLSILHRGLQVAPFGTRLNGDLFGRGIYFSDNFAKSARYCGGSSPRFVFLCEVALGKIHPVQFEYATGLAKGKSAPPGFHSLKTSNSLSEPNPSSTVIWKGRTVPLGIPIPNPLMSDKNNYGGLKYNEYIVFNENQVILRYLIEFK